MIKSSLIILLTISFLACSKTDQYGNATKVNAKLIDILPENNQSTSPPPLKEEVSDKNKVQNNSKKIIKNGEMTIAVAKIADAKSQVETILKKFDAYSQNETFRNSDTSEDLNLIIRVPSQNFDALINSFSNGIGSVEFKSIKADDVTEEYTEVSIRLANKKIYLDKYREMLKKASTTKDILEVQENIRALEDEIDVAEGRLRFIDDRVNYSTLNLNLHKEKIRSSATSKIGFGNRFGDSLTEGWNTFVSFFLGIISFWPFLIFLPFVVFLWRKWKVKNKAK